MAKHLVTGGSGFLGNLIAKQLLQSGETVKVLDVWKDETQDSEIQFIKSDIRDFDKVSNAMRGVDYIHHNVALVPLAKNKKEFWSVNVEGSKIAAKAAIANNVKNFVHMSSSAIYGIPVELPVTASTPTKPVEDYGKAKLAGEIEVARIFNKKENNLIIIRPRTILGPGRLGIFQILFKWIQENRNIYTLGKGDNFYQFIHADDLISAYMLAFSQNASGTYNVGTDRFGSMADSLRNLIQYANSNSKLISLPEFITATSLSIASKMNLIPLGPYHYKMYGESMFFDLKEIKELGWIPKYSNDEMFRQTFDSYLQIGNLSFTKPGTSPHRSKIHEGLLGLVRRLS